MENASSITVKDCALKAAGAEKTTIPFFAPFLYYKYTMNVPRQARDRRRKSSGKMCVCAGIAAIWMEEANQNHTISVSSLNAAETLGARGDFWFSLPHVCPEPVLANHGIIFQPI